MPDASRVNITDEDFSAQSNGTTLGISGFAGTFQRGPIGVVSPVITSTNELRKIYGGYVNGNNDYLLASRILDRGTKLRIVNVRHYTDPADPSTLTAVKATKQSLKVVQGASDVNIADLVPKHAGANYNNLKVVLGAPSNGLAAQGYFNLTIYIQGDEFYTTETYNNLQIVGKPTATNATWLNEVRQRSQYVNVVYLDTTAITNPVLTPKPETLSFTGGTDGGAVMPTDFAGSKAGKTGFYAFDGISDMFDFAAPNITESSVHIAGASYAQSRGEIEYLAHIDYTGGAAAMIAARAAITVDSKYYSVFSGGVRIIHPITNEEIVISEVADVMGIGTYVATERKPWIAMDNYVKGFIPNAIGVGASFSPEDLNLLANRQINMIVNEENDRGAKVVFLKGNFSGQSSFSKYSWRNIVRLVIYVKKSLRPTLTKYLSEPNEFTTWKLIYNEVKPFLKSLEDGKAVYPGGWVWNGDQYATQISDLKINVPADVDAGKYKARLKLNAVPGINEIDLAIAMSNSTGIDFTETETT